MNAPLPRPNRAGCKTLDANGHLIHYMAEGAGWRYDTLLEKEPETIEWIDGFEPGDTFWDIGANVGIYSVYAGVKGIRTMAFEPHFANYQQLCITLALNGLQDLVTPLCLAFAESKSIAAMNLASLDIGTSMSNFGEALDFRGQPFQPAFRQGMIGYDIDSFIADFGVDIPTHLKIDVDGIELPIIRGARRMLASEKLESVSVELIETDLEQLAAVTGILEQAGLRFVHKKQNPAFSTPQTRDVLNYLFCRRSAKQHPVPARATAQDEPALASVRPDPSTSSGLKAVEGPLEIAHIVDHIVDRLAAAPVDPAPSANIYMQDILPPAVYREMLERLPHDAALDPIDHPDAVTQQGRCTRFLLDLTPASLARLEPRHQPFWGAMIDVFTAPAVAQAIVKAFAPTLRKRFGDTLPELVAVPIFYRDHPGYRIGVHPDAPSKVATLQFYLPADDSQRHLGTVFHRLTQQGFERLKANSFSPNTAYAFVRTDESWHSVDELGAGEKPRNSIALTFYLAGQEYRSGSTPAQAPQSAPAAPALIAETSIAGEPDQSLRELVKTFTRRENVATLFRAGGVGVELGVAAGDFSQRILDHDHVGYLYSIDMWAGDRGHGVEQYREAIVRLHPYRDRNAIMRMRFDEAVVLFDDASLDFVYVDGYAHDGELNGQTFREWYPKLRSGGIIAGDDYAPDWPLVVAAVDRFVAAHGLELHVIDCHEDSWNSKYPTWFAVKR